MSAAAPTPGLTSSQTVGPFFTEALLRDPWNVLVTDGTDGERIRVEGRVLDGDGNPVADAMVEIWQANGDFTGFGRSGTDDEGRFWFETVKPGPVPFDDTRLQAPHLSMTVFARGMLNHAATRLYFADDPANDTDPILALVPERRRGTLLARRDESGESVVYRLDIVLQGRGETVFFNI
jgi:protocatechuate 3,4-dioxygenase alpha subunit